MSATFFLNPTSRIAIARRVAEWRRHFHSLSGLMNFSDHRSVDIPLTKAEVRAEVAKWYWQI
jgi:uncharacterized protein YjiS (DUF1127 family)